MARPRKPTDERLTERIEFTVRRSDFLRAAEDAAKAHMTRTAFNRQLFLEGRVVIMQTRQLDYATYDQLRRIGVNLNQLTRRFNQTDEYPAGLSDLCALIHRFLMENIDDIKSHQKGP